MKTVKPNSREGPAAGPSAEEAELFCHKRRKRRPNHMFSGNAQALAKRTAIYANSLDKD